MDLFEMFMIGGIFGVGCCTAIVWLKSRHLTKQGKHILHPTTAVGPIFKYAWRVKQWADDTNSIGLCEHGVGETDYCEPCGRINTSG